MTKLCANLTQRHTKTARHITKPQWEVFEQKLEAIAMEPEDFLSQWDCTYEEMAKICQCHRNTVANWFQRNGRRPRIIHKIWLGVANRILLTSRY